MIPKSVTLEDARETVRFAIMSALAESADSIEAGYHLHRLTPVITERLMIHLFNMPMGWATLMVAKELNKRAD